MMKSQEGLSAADMIERIRSDGKFPSSRRTEARWAIQATCRWAEIQPAMMPFTAKAMRETLSQVSSGRAGVERKTVQNARSSVEFVLRHYGLDGSGCFSAPLTEECVIWASQLSKYERASLSKLFRYLSWRGIGLIEFDARVSEAFATALFSELPQKKARSIATGTIRAWNTLCKGRPDWPGRPLAGGDRPLRAVAWSALPTVLREDVDRLFAARSSAGNLFSDGNNRRPLKATTVRARRDHLRIVASTLVQKHLIAADSLTGLAELCRPERFEMVIKTLAERYDGAVTAYVEQVAVTLLQAAEEGNCLDPAEIEEVRRLKRMVYRQRLRDQRTEVHRDLAILDELDDDAAMARVLAVPARMAARVQKSGRCDRRAALDIQLATAVALLLAAPLRISNLASLRLYQHVRKVRDQAHERFVIRVPGEETKNGKPLEHYLDDQAAALLALYIGTFRPLLVSSGCPWLWPGRKGRHKHAQVLGRQISAVVREESGIPFHPHLARKIAVKVILDQNPGGIEIARRLLGHTDTRPTLTAYAQTQSRSAQREYLSALEERRLASLGSLDGLPGQRPLRVGKGRHLGAGGS